MSRSEPSGRVTRAGTSVCGGRLPGASSAGCPGVRLKPVPRFWSPMPVRGSNSRVPNPAAFDWM